MRIRPIRRSWPYSISSRLAAGMLALIFALAAPAADLPDPVLFGTRIESGDLEQARAWLDAGLHPDFVGDRVGTGLMIGAWEGNIPMMELFVARGASINKTNVHGERAIMHAAWRGHLAAMNWLIARGAEVNSGPMQWSALHYAAFAGHGELLTALLERGADINARSTNGSSVLMMAVYEGHEPVVKLLLARGADRSIRNDRGEGALEWAFKFRHHAVARAIAAEDFAAAASKPKAAWGEGQRSVPKPAPSATSGARQIADLENMRDILAERGLKDSVAKLDQRIAELRAREGRPSEGTQIDDLLKMREQLLARKQKAAVTALDRRIASLRYKRAVAERDVPPAAVLEISASRSAPTEQSMRMLEDAKARDGTP